MPLHSFCRFPITRYEGEYRPTWTRRWTRIGGTAGSWQFFGFPRDILLDNDGEPYTWKGEFGFHGLFPMLAGPRNDWGAFNLMGLLQLDSHGSICKACGCVTLRENDLNQFVAAGRTVRGHRDTDMYRLTPDVYCIPGTGGKISLTLVTINRMRTEVYFLGGRDTGDIRSQLPGLPEFYRAATIKRFFGNLANLWRGVCADGQTDDCGGEDDFDSERRELWRRTGYLVC